MGGRWGPSLLGAALVLLAACPHAKGPINVRTSRPGAGTIVGVTVRADAPVGAVESAFAAIQYYEAQLSEWQVNSLTTRAGGGKPQHLDPHGAAMFRFAGELFTASEGAFNVAWRGGSYQLVGDVLTAEVNTQFDLGGVLKGFLADRAVDALRASGCADFAVDVGGDVVVGGSEHPGGYGWPIVVAVADITRTMTVHGAISTSSQEQQPGHIVDARSGEAASALAGVVVLADTGLVADGTATTIMAFGGPILMSDGACALLFAADGTERSSCGPGSVLVGTGTSVPADGGSPQR